MTSLRLALRRLLCRWKGKGHLWISLRPGDEDAPVKCFRCGADFDDFADLWNEGEVPR